MRRWCPALGESSILDGSVRSANMSSSVMFSSMTVFVRRGARARAAELALKPRLDETKVRGTAAADEEEEGERHDLRARERRDEEEDMVPTRRKQLLVILDTDSGGRFGTSWGALPHTPKYEPIEIGASFHFRSAIVIVELNFFFPLPPRSSPPWSCVQRSAC
jgi:hypothetical protein